MLTKGFGISNERASILINAIETDLFFPDGNKKPLFSFMPRKNERDASIVTELLKSQPWFKGWKLEKIENYSQNDVISTFQKSLCLLSFGHPEGFGLPLAEAAACGCALIGYTGLGGREIFELGKPNNSVWSVEYGDWYKFIKSAKELVELSKHQIDFAMQLNSFSTSVRKEYSKEKMLTSLKIAISKWESFL